MRRPIVRGLLMGLALLALFATLGARAGWVTMPFERPDGPWSWLSSRAAGVAAYVAITTEVVFGLWLSTGAADRWIARANSAQIHRWLSVVALGLVAGHALVLLGDRYVRFDLLDVVVPFVAPGRRVAVGLGVLAAWLALVVHASFGLRKRIGPKTWRLLHYLSFAIFVLATLHGLAAGSDTRSPAMVALYGSAGLAVGLLTVRRVAEATVTRRAKRAAC